MQITNVPHGTKKNKKKMEKEIKNKKCYKIVLVNENRTNVMNLLEAHENIARAVAAQNYTCKKFKMEIESIEKVYDETNKEEEI